MLKSAPPPEQLTSQELIYLAAGARLLALQCERDASERANPTQRQFALESAQVYRELTAKVERIAHRMSGSGRPVA